MTAPERANAINGHVTGVAEEMVGDPDTPKFGFKFTLQIDTFDIESGAG